MKTKLIISLLALCLMLSVASAQAQTDTSMAGSMKDMNAILTGNIAETITCNMTGNVVVVGQENMTEAMGQAQTGSMTENQTQSMAQTQAQNMTEGQTGTMAANQTGTMAANQTGTTAANQTGTMAANQTETMAANQTGTMAANQTETMAANQTGTMAANQTEAMTRPVTFDMVGKIFIVKDMGNRTEKALMIGKIDKVPGKVVMFGKTNKMDEAGERMEDVSGTAGYMKNMTIVTVGGMTGTMTCNLTRNMGEAGSTENMTGRMENMTVLMAGNVAGTIKGDLTRKMVIVRNIGSMNEITEKMCNMSGKMENTSGSTENMSGRMENTTGSMCNMTGSMIILKDMGDMTGAAEKMDATTEMTKIMDYLSLMDGSMVIITDRATDSRMEDKDITRAFENRNNIIGEMAIIKNMDDTTQIMTKTFTCNMTGNTTTVQAGSMAGRMGGM